MAIRLPSHLHKNRYGVYGFRIVIPRDLQLVCPRHEIRISLRTTIKSQAKPHALRLSLLTSNYFAKIRHAPTFEEALANGEALLQALSGNTFDEVTDWLDALSPQLEGESGEPLRKLVALRTKYSTNKAAKLAFLKATIEQLPGKSDAEIDSLFCDLYADLTPLVIEGNTNAAELNCFTLAAQKTLQDAVHALEIRAMADAQESEIGSITDMAAEIAAKVTIKVANNISMNGANEPLSALASEQLGAIVEAYCANQISEGCWTSKTEAENRAIFSLWLRIVGDQPIREYRFEQHNDYKTTLSKLPPNLNKSPRYREKSIEEILGMNCQAAAPNTINKNLVRISALFDWAMRYGRTDLNPAKGMLIRNPKRANEERKAFSDNDLGKYSNLQNIPSQVTATHTNSGFL